MSCSNYPKLSQCYDSRIQYCQNNGHSINLSQPARLRWSDRDRLSLFSFSSPTRTQINPERMSLYDAYALWGIDADNEWEAVGGFRRKPLYVNGVKLGYTNADEGWELLLLLGKYLGEATYGKLPDTSNMSASVRFIWNRLHTGDNEPIRYKLIGRAKSPEIKRLTDYLTRLRGSLSKKSEQDVIRDIQAFLKTPESKQFLKSEYKGASHPYYGHCYVASQVLYHKLGGDEMGYTVYRMDHEGTSHWFLKNPAGKVLDPTWRQFKTKPDYSKAKRVAFLTKEPSKRAQDMIVLLK
jgi:hypothetical protein